MNRFRNDRSAGRAVRTISFLTLLIAVCTTVAGARKPVVELWYAHVAPPYWLDAVCRSQAPHRKEALADYARRVPAFDLDCIRDRAADATPDPAGSVRYLIANTLLYIQRYRTDQAAFAPIDIIARMELTRTPDDPRMLYVASELLFHGATYQPARAGQYVPCAERLAQRARDLGYDDAIWALTRNEQILVRYENNLPCNIQSLRKMLE